MYEKAEKLNATNSRLCGQYAIQKKSTLNPAVGFLGDRYADIAQRKMHPNIRKKPFQVSQNQSCHFKCDKYVGNQQTPESDKLRRSNRNRHGVIQRAYYFYDPTREGDDRYVWCRWPASMTPGIRERMIDGVQETHNDYGVWESNVAAQVVNHLVRGAEDMENAYHEIRDDAERIGPANALVAHGANIVDNAVERAIEQLPREQQAVIEEAQSLSQYIREWAREHYIKATGILFGGGILLVGIQIAIEVLLKLLSVPWYVKMGVNIAEAVYGVLVTMKWIKSKLLPFFATAVLTGANMGVFLWGLYHILNEGMEGEWFEDFHATALPGALLLEQLTLYGINKIQDARQQANRPLLQNV